MRTTGLVAAAAAIGCSTEPAPPLPELPPPPPWGVPVSGGTLLVARDGAVVIGDPDRDRVVLLDAAEERVLAEVPLPGDEPGRIVEDAAGRVHVALRRGGAILTLASARSGEIVARRPVCAEPRGLAYEASTDRVHVACAGGELVSLPAPGGPAVRALRLDRDLRDVVVTGAGLVVTRFRSAQILTLDPRGAVVGRTAPPPVSRMGESLQLVAARAAVAWRAIAAPGGGVLVTHQRQREGALRVEPGGYGGRCSPTVEAALALASPGAAPVALQAFAQGALPVDVAINAAGTQVAVVTAGDRLVRVSGAEVLASRDRDRCIAVPGAGGPGAPGAPQSPPIGPRGDELGIPTAVAYTPTGDLVIYYPEVPALGVRALGTGPTRAIALPGAVGYDAGRAVFHRQGGAAMACASCHPEGREDGLVWTFAGEGARRTQSLAGGILARGPFHWVGDMEDLDTLMTDVLTGRMLGGTLTPSERRSVGPWLDRVPAPAPAPRADAAAIARGATVYAAARCDTCHGGPLLTTNALADVGTGRAFKVPSLIGVAARAPFMHSGCAATLRDRFTSPCGGGDAHGATSALTAGQLDDLVAYLESL